MKAVKWKVVCIAFAMCLMPLAVQAMVFPGSSWQEGTPESQNVDSAKLNAALDTLKCDSGSDGLSETIIIRDGVIIWKGKYIDTQHGVWSVTKSFTSTALGLMINEGRCSLTTLARAHEPLLNNLYPTVNLRHFVTMTSGYNALNQTPGIDRWGKPREDWSENPYNPTQPLSSPGSTFLYWDEAMLMAGRVLTRISNTTLRNYLQSRLMSPIGIGSNAWSWDTEGSVAGININKGCTGINISAQDLARFGLLFLNNGNWNGKQVVPAAWVRAATSNQVPASINNSPQSPSEGSGWYGYNWWVNGRNRNGRRLLPDAPANTFYANGFNHNMCFVIPEWNMVIVRMGMDGNPEDKAAVWNRVLGQIGDALMDGSTTPSNNNTRLPASDSDNLTSIFDSENITFTLVNAATDRDLYELDGNDTIDINRVGSRLNVRADVQSSSSIGMVAFYLNGALIRQERTAPYALVGDDPTGDYLIWTPGAGSYTLEAVAYNSSNSVVLRRRIPFRVVNSSSNNTSPTGSTGSSASASTGSGIIFTLVNAATDRDLYELDNNDTIDISRVGSRLNVRADVQSGSSIGMVAFYLNGALMRQERTSPYALAGDNPTGDYLIWTPGAGSYTLEAVAFNSSNNVVERRTIQFQVSVSTSGGSISEPTAPGTGSTTVRFNPGRDMISLHFDHCADPDDGHSAVADRTMIGAQGIPLARIHVVSGTSGTQPNQYQSASETVMTSAWGQNGWQNAHANWKRAVGETMAAWSETIDAGASYLDSRRRSIGFYRRSRSGSAIDIRSERHPHQNSSGSAF